MKPLRDPILVRNLVFGIEDSVVSTVGILAGLDTEHATRAAILSTAVIYIVVEAVSMAVGSFLSEESAQDSVGSAHSLGSALKGGTAMFISFVVAGLVPATPYLIATGTTALIYSVIASLCLLFALGFLPLRSRVSRLGRALRMVVLGGVAIAVGILIGAFFGVH